MDDLIEYCVEYIVANLQSVVTNGEGVSTYKSHIAKKIAQKIDIEELDRIVDHEDLILNRLFKKKLELFFEHSSNLLYLC